MPPDPRTWLRQRRGMTASVGTGGPDPRAWLRQRRGAPPVLEQDDETTWGDTAVSTGLRVVPAIAGGVAGVAGGPVGVAAGGGVGGAFGEWLAQQYEQARGLRDDTNLKSVAVEAALGAIPLGKTATIAKAAAKGAGMGAAGTVGHALAETGELPDVGQLAVGTVAGGAFGGTAQAALNRFLRPRAAATPGTTPPDVQAAPGATAGAPDPKAWLAARRAQGGHPGLAGRPTAGFARYAAADAAIRQPAPAPSRPLSTLATDSGLLPIHEMSGRDLRLDPSTYQFKESDTRGVTGALKGVTEWDPLAGAASPVVVHRRLDGSTYVADGHQRVNKWQELAAAGQELPPLRTVMLDEAQGYDVPTVRRIVSLKNVREGSADPVDIAKLLRTGPLSDAEARSMPRGSVAGPKLAQAESLSNLDDRAFQAVVNREVPSQWGAMVGRSGADPNQQLTLIRSLAGADLSNDVEADAFVKELLRGDFEQVTMNDLFGESIQAVSLAENIAKIIGRTTARLGRQKRTFNQAIKNADTLESAGNTLVRDENTRRAQQAAELADQFTLYRDKSGTATREALKSIAARLVRGETTLAESVDELLPALQRDIATGGGAVRPAVTDAAERTARGGDAPGVRPLDQLPLGTAADDAADAGRAADVDPSRAELEAAGQRGLFGDESGRVSSELAMRGGMTLAGGTAGGAMGAATADENATPGDVLARFLAGAGVGAALGAGGSRALTRRAGQTAARALPRDTPQGPRISYRPEDAQRFGLPVERFPATDAQLERIATKAPRRLPATEIPRDVPVEDVERFGLPVDKLPVTDKELARIATKALRRPQKLRDESGRVSGELAMRGGAAVTGGVTGGAIGSATADEDATAEERFARFLAGAGVGAAAGAGGVKALSKFLTPARQTPIELARDAGLSHERITEAIRNVSQQHSTRKTLKTATGRARGARAVVEFSNDPTVPPASRQPKVQRETFLRPEKFPEPLRQPIQELGESVGLVQLERQRRGRQSWRRTEALAQHLRVDAGGPLKPGTALNAEQTRAYQLALASVVHEQQDLAKRYANTGNTADGVRLLQLKSAQEALIASTAGARSEAGRALNIWRQMVRLQPAEIRLASEFMKRGRLRADMDDLAEQLTNLPKDPAAAARAIAAMERHTLTQKATSYYTANILSGIKTYNRNLLGNLANMVSRIAVKGATAAPIDLLKATLTNRPREVFASEALHETLGAAYATTSAMRDAFETLRHGFSPTALEEGLSGMTTLYLPKKEFAGGLANPFNVPGRLLEATDRFFVTMNRNAELYGRTYARARQEGTARKLAGRALQDYIASRSAELRVNPTPDLLQAAMKEAEYATFREEGGAFANMMIQLKKKVPAAGFVIPFVKTVSNIFRQGVEHTPAGFFMKRAQSDDMREATVAQAKAAFGSIMALPLAYAAVTGRLSGAGPKEPSERAALYEQGWRPNSIKLPIPDAVATSIGASKSDDGEYWVNYSLFQPFSIPAALIANGVESYVELSKRSTEQSAQQHIEEIAAQWAARVANTAISQTYLQGVFGLVGALESPERGAVKFARQLARGFVPLSGLSNSLAQATDDTLREADTIAEDVQRITPGLSKNLRPRLDRFGRPIKREGSAIRRAAMVPEVEPVRNDPISKELQRLDVTVGIPSQRIDLTDPRTGKPSKQLTAEEGHQLREVRGQSTRAALARIILAPGYRRLPDHIKRERIEDALSRAGRRTSRVTRTAFRRNRPDLITMLRDRARREIGRFEGGPE